MATMDERVLNVEAEVNKLKGAYDHLATKADLEKAKWQLAAFVAAVVSIAVAVLKFWE